LFNKPTQNQGRLADFFSREAMIFE
jgi:hypothetical protein